MDELIRLEHVEKRYGDRVALAMDSLCIQRGGVTALVGPNGAGKTTLLNLLALLDQPSAGRVIMGGDDVIGSATARQAWRRKITLVHQAPYLFSGSVLKNVRYGLKIRHQAGAAMEAQVESALKAVGLESFRQRRAAALSAGERQRVALARALAVMPEVLLLDEPLAHIDQAYRARMEDTIREAGKNGMTVVMATHQLDSGLVLADHVIALADGRKTDVPVRNHIAGQVVMRNAERMIKLASGHSIHVATEKNGVIHIAINPEDIILALKPLESSARNVMPGVIVGLHQEKALVRVTVDVGCLLEALITPQSMVEMQLQPGRQVYAVFKTSAVRVL